MHIDNLIFLIRIHTNAANPLILLDLQAFMWYNFHMEKKLFTEEELNTIPKEMITKMYLQLVDSFDLLNRHIQTLVKQNNTLTKNIDLLNDIIMEMDEQGVSSYKETIALKDNCSVTIELTEGEDTSIIGSIKDKIFESVYAIHKVEAVVHGRNMVTDILQQKQSLIMLLQ